MANPSPLLVNGLVQNINTHLMMYYENNEVCDRHAASLGTTFQADDLECAGETHEYILA